MTVSHIDRCGKQKHQATGQTEANLPMHGKRIQDVAAHVSDDASGALVVVMCGKQGNATEQFVGVEQSVEYGVPQVLGGVCRQFPFHYVKAQQAVVDIGIDVFVEKVFRQRSVSHGIDV